MRLGVRIALGCATALGASLLLARVHPFGNPGFDAAPPAQGLMENAAVPAEVRATLTAKCADCHSMQTHLPDYDRIAIRFAPVSWLLESDVVDGRRHMNLSRWESWSADEQQRFAAKIVQQMKARSMPPLQYRLIHRNTVVTDADVATFTAWLHGMQAPTAVAAVTATGDAARGGEIFEKRCSGCHALDRSREGPRLGNVFGRTSGQVAGFAYSPALARANLVWNEETLNAWLTDTDGLVPGNNMDFRVPQAQERVDLIAFLKRNAGNEAN